MRPTIVACAALLLALGPPAVTPGGQEPGVLRVVAYGDDEGTCRRWNERLSAASPCQPSPYRAASAACPRGENARRAKLLHYLREGAGAVHAVLHAGDFVRFDPNVVRYAAPECAGTECDHFLDIAIASRTVSVRAQLIDPLPADAAMDTVTWTRGR